ncbi:dehydratase [Paramagnetospirillum caucaseum]|uniref:Dehydratase n=1 Tax=Paramagnetospirillum caucaseum TaxID=1244869 RepID=M2ZN42_9PROT|nr:MaoC family dehydratase [Paramagnetospirillum caucaseum]EME68707.1 dehydratase [Paramagnetospirillum caucaseum]
MTKTNSGNFFEDFRLGQVISHATPRTVTAGDVALYTALYGSRFAVNSSAEFAKAIGLAAENMGHIAPVDDLLAFHVVFGKTVPDISLNAVANLGYAMGRFGEMVYPGDTITTTSTVIGLKENSNKQTGVVYVRSVGTNQLHEMVVDYVRWVMVRKRDQNAATSEEKVPELPGAVAAADLVIPDNLRLGDYDTTLAGSPHLWDDYAVGEKIDHVDGMTIEEAEHMMATRLWQNTAKVHFNQYTEGQGRFGRRLIYGGHIISIARALSFNGLGNAFKLVAINGGRHTNPTFAGDTIHAWTEVLEKIEVPGRKDVGALRLRLVATKNQPCAGFPLKAENGKDFDPAVVLDFDYTVLMPRKK